MLTGPMSACERGEAIPGLKLWVAIVGLLTVSLAVSGQERQSERLPRFRIESADDVAVALSAGSEIGWGLRAAIVALEGRRASLLVRELLQRPDVSDLVKERAMSVATYTRDSLLAGDLLDLAQRDSGMLSVRAWEALPLLPYPGVCQHWRETLHASLDSHKRSLAIVGLGYCGSTADIPLLERLNREERIGTLRADAADALARIRRAPTDRFDRGVWAPGPFGDGDFHPGPEVADLMQRSACGGPCSGPILLDPARPLPAQRR